MLSNIEPALAEVRAKLKAYEELGMKVRAAGELGSKMLKDSICGTRI